MEINVAIIEDSDDEYFLLEKCLKEYSETGKCTFNITRYIYSEGFLEKYKPMFDLVLMDIMLPGMNGMDAAHKLRQFDANVALVFITNMSQYAIKGYEVSAIDYILKPINYNSFVMKIERALRCINKPKEGQTLKIRSNGGTKLVDTADIYYIDIFGHDINTHTANEVTKSYGTLAETEKQLTGAGFSRCSACALINLKYVEGIYGNDVKLTNGILVRMGRKWKQSFMSSLSQYLFGGQKA